MKLTRNAYISQYPDLLNISSICILVSISTNNEREKRREGETGKCFPVFCVLVDSITWRYNISEHSFACKGGNGRKWEYYKEPRKIKHGNVLGIDVPTCQKRE